MDATMHCDSSADGEELVHITDEILGSPRAAPVKRKGGGPRLTDAQRMEILHAIETAVEAQVDNKNLLKPKIPTKRLADEYGVTPAAIRKLVKQKDKFLSRFATGREDVRQTRRRGGDGAKVEFERELYRWVCGLRARNVTIVPSYIQQRALLIAKKYPNMDKFQASWGCLKTPLILAAERGDLKAVKLLVKFGANIEATDEVTNVLRVNTSGAILWQDDGTALMAALKHGQRDVVEFLVKKGANKEARHIVSSHSDKSWKRCVCVA
ncbi:hypothetical protein DYB32_006488 [Aphanomyces invadans]|uniref:Uncharacterized protein n=1 Tax=Aphanomyces invadans TaxID=157072 RepID=A0A418ARK3_9STRA|nr:hypothetical protein DYB32_006488 [Aphanomyces invadans]